MQPFYSQYCDGRVPRVLKVTDWPTLCSSAGQRRHGGGADREELGHASLQQGLPAGRLPSHGQAGRDGQCSPSAAKLPFIQDTLLDDISQD